MWHPFDSMPFVFRIILLPTFIIALFAFWNQLQKYDAILRGESETRVGIIEFELAYSAEESRHIVDSWRDAGVLETARRSLQVDFGFIVVYSVVFSFAWSRVARGLSYLSEQFAKWNWRFVSRIAFRFLVTASVFTLLQWVAGLLDVIENCALLYMLEVGVSNPWPIVAATAAAAKFCILLPIVLAVPLVLFPYLIVRCGTYLSALVRPTPA